MSSVFAQMENHQEPQCFLEKEMHLNNSFHVFKVANNGFQHFPGLVMVSDTTFNQLLLGVQVALDPYYQNFLPFAKSFF